MAAAAAAKSETKTGSGLKCATCRSVCLASPEHLAPERQGATANSRNEWDLNVENLPEWILAAVQEKSWTKGRLHCPNCGTKVGGFDFVGAQGRSKRSSSSPSTGSSSVCHLVNCKVDPFGPEFVSLPLSSLAEEADFRGDQADHMAAPADDREPSDNGACLPTTSLSLDEGGSSDLQLHSGGSSTASSSDDSRSLEDCSDLNEDCFYDDDEDCVGDSKPPDAEGDAGHSLGAPLPAALSPAEQVWGAAKVVEVDVVLGDRDEDVAVAVVPGTKRLKLIKSRTKRLLSGAVAGSLGHPASRGQRHRIRPPLHRHHLHYHLPRRDLPEVVLLPPLSSACTKQRRLKEIVEAEPELDQVDPNLICPVCLDLLHDPCLAVPCKHVFCDPCLRRLGSKNPMNTFCPMCRQRILFCQANAELAKSIQAQHPEMCRKRKEFERGLPGLNSLPLPWKPGWRNLLLGRPMGGNRFAGDSLGDSLGRVVQQLPYYIPPVVFANIMNLVFFVLVLGVVEAVPALISLIIGSIQHPEGLASFKKQVLVAAGGSGAAGEAPDRDNQASLGIMDDALGALADVGLPSDPGSIDGDPVAGAALIAQPEAASQVLDATLYYVLCSVSLVAAAFGNFMLMQHQPIFGLLPRVTFMDRLHHNHRAWGRHFQRFSDLALIMVISCVPVLVLPLLVPVTAEEGSPENVSWMRNSMIRGAETVLNALELIQSYLTLPFIAVVGLIYSVGSMYLDHGLLEDA